MSDEYKLPEQKALWQQVHGVLERMIVHRAIEPGARLREQELSERFGVSRGPVREAILALQRDLWVELQHNHGAYVRRPEPGEADQLFEVRQCLESQAASLAADRISEQEIKELDELIRKGFAALERGDIEKVVDLNTQFQRMVTGATRNQILVELMEQIEKKVVWYLSAVMSFRGDDSWLEHQELIEAFKERDGEAAAAIMERHTEATYDAYVDSGEELVEMEELEEAGLK
jgi:DNA-binding GntR family transcriptional regulator